MRAFALAIVALVSTALAAPSAELEARQSPACFVNDPLCNVKCAAGSAYLDCSRSYVSPLLQIFLIHKFGPEEAIWGTDILRPLVRGLLAPERLWTMQLQMHVHVNT
jgi:hypothetical protein